MEMQRKQPGQGANGRDGGQCRYLTVDLPLPHEGVGNALRATFRPARNDLPDDMLELLARLDGH